MYQSIQIRNACLADLDDILNIYAFARKFMREHNNPTQWKNNHPSRELVKNDLDNGNLYVILKDNIVCAVFVLIIGEDPTYKNIYDGSWISNTVYGTIHRVASNQTINGVFNLIVKYCLTKIKHLRVDTHPDNIIMQNVILKEGFIRCGTIFVGDGTKRIAYEKI